MTDFPTPIATVDIVLLAMQGGVLHIGLIERDKPPFPGALALPGGYIHADHDKSLESAVRRVLKDKTGLRPRYMEQLQSFGGPKRDPRGWSVSVAYFVLVNDDDMASSRQIKIVPTTSIPRLPFDHAHIVDTAISRLRRKSTYSALPAYLLGDTFTLSELQAAYELVLGRMLQKTPFRTKILDREIIEPVEDIQRGAGRPAQLYRVRPGRSPEFNGVISNLNI